MQITISGQQFGFDALNGVSNNTTTFARFLGIVDGLQQVGEGLTGGTHGTEHAYQDYRVSPELVVRVVQPGALRQGHLELIEWSETDTNALAESDRAFEAECEAAEREYRKMLAQEA